MAQGYFIQNTIFTDYALNKINEYLYHNIELHENTLVNKTEDNLEFKKHYPNTTVKCFKGKFHCENALFHPEIMIEELDKIFDK